MRLHENKEYFADAIEAAAHPQNEGGLGISEAINSLGGSQPAAEKARLLLAGLSCSRHSAGCGPRGLTSSAMRRDCCSIRASFDCMVLRSESASLMALAISV